MRSVRGNGFFRVFAIFLVCNLLYLTGGCASKMTVMTTPSEADVYVKGEHIGKSPATYNGTSGLPDSTVEVEAKKEGYKDTKKLVKREPNVIYILLSVLIFLPGILWSFDLPENVNITLEPEDQQQPSQKSPGEA